MHPTDHPTYRATSRAYETIGMVRRAIAEARDAIDALQRDAQARADDAAGAYTVAYQHALSGGMGPERADDAARDHDARGDRETARVASLATIRAELDDAARNATGAELSILRALALYAHPAMPESDPFGEG